MDLEQARILKDKMLEFLYRDNDGILARYGDMIEIGMELKCDEDTSRSLALALHSDGFIQMVDPYTAEAYMTESGLKHLQAIYIGTSRDMKKFEPRNPGLTKLGDAQDPKRPRTTIPGKVILVVDDDPSVIEGMQRILNGMGYVMDSAQDGLAGLNKALMINPALIFLDVNMPAAEGTSVYDRLRREANTSEIPVVFVTGNEPDLLKSRITPGPSTFYLQKPVSLDLIRDTIRKIFDGQS
jgi:CheY-like chemotaxis protein